MEFRPSRPFYLPKLGPPRRTSRQQILAEWRGVDLAPLEKGQTSPSQPASQIMERVLARLNINQRRSQTEIVKVWNQMLDPDIIAHAQPTGLRKGTLFVSVDNSVWLGEIVRYRQKEILERMQHCFGRETITRISFRLG